MARPRFFTSTSWGLGEIFAVAKRTLRGLSLILGFKDRKGLQDSAVMGLETNRTMDQSLILYCIRSYDLLEISRGSETRVYHGN